MDQAAIKRAERARKRTAMGDAAYKAQETAARNDRKRRAQERAIPAPVPVITPPERKPRRSTKEIMALIKDKAPPVPERKTKEPPEPERLTSENVNDNEMIRFKDVKEIIKEHIEKSRKSYKQRINDLDDEFERLAMSANTGEKTEYQIGLIKEKQVFIWRTKKEMYNYGAFELEDTLHTIEKDVSETRIEKLTTERRERANKQSEERRQRDIELKERHGPERHLYVEKYKKIDENNGAIYYSSEEEDDDEKNKMGGGELSTKVKIGIKKDIKETTIKNYMYKINAFHKLYYKGDVKDFLSWVYDGSLIENINKSYDKPEQKRSLMTAILSILSRDREMSTHTELLDWYRTAQNIYQQQINEKKN
jgi:hypothetical protein